MFGVGFEPRRWTIGGLVLLICLSLALSACGGATPAPTESGAAVEQPTSEPTSEPTIAPTSAPSGPLRILEWSGYEATEYPEFFAPFTDKYEGQVADLLEYSFFAEDSEAFAKLQSGFHADVVHPCNSWWQLYVDQGLVQPIDTSRLSNWDGVNADLAAMGQFNGEQYFIPWEWGYDSIIVRQDLVPEMPTSWADLWDPQYAGHVSIWDNAETSFVMTALAYGMDPWNTTPEQQDEIKQHLIDLKGNLLTYWSDYTESYDLPTTGDVWLLANAWQDAYAYVKDSGYDVAYLQPEEGRLGWVCGYGITSDAQNVDLAYELIDASIAPDSMAALGNEYWYGFSNLDALPQVDDYVVEFMDLNQVDTLTDRTVFYQPLTEEQRAMMSDIWDEVKASQ